MAGSVRVSVARSTFATVRFPLCQRDSTLSSGEACPNFCRRMFSVSSSTEAVRGVTFVKPLTLTCLR